MRNGWYRFVLTSVTVLIGFGALSIGCRKSTSPPIPPTPPGPTLETLWPHADSTIWIYLQSQQAGFDPSYYYPDSSSVPVATIALADSMLAKQPQANAIPGADSVYFVQAFLGNVTTMSGVTGQALEWGFVSLPATQLAIAPPRAAHGARGRDPLLEGLWRTRPDLRSRLPRPAPDQLEGAAYNLPLFIRAYAWASTPSAIVGYGDLYTDPAWKYLESNLSTGHEFHLQLVRTLADDVWLHGKVVGVFSGMTSRGMVTDGRIIHYLVDYGMGEDTGPGGEINGYYRQVAYGRVIYAPGIGAVADYEENYVPVAPVIETSSYRLKLEIYPSDTPLDPLAVRGAARFTAAALRPRR